MYVMFLCKPALLECWGRHLGGSRTGVGTDLGVSWGFASALVGIMSLSACLAAL